MAAHDAAQHQTHVTADPADRAARSPGDQEVARVGMPPIAIVGLACLFPQAASLQQYWDNIVSGRDCITDVPPSRWRLDDYYDPDPAAPDKTYVRRGGFIPDVEFDPVAFGLPPNILEVTDTSQLLGLVVARQALEDAGYAGLAAREFDRARAGVILGVGGGQNLIEPLISRLQYPRWERVLRASGLAEEETRRISEMIKLSWVGWEENAFPGLLGNVIAGRIANRLDLGGPNCVVDAACAGSLAAVKMAMAELAMGTADLMITGGVDTDNSPFMYMCFSKTPALSRRNQIRPFDADSDGILIGEGIGMLVLKRLDDARRDGDRIYAVIKGLGGSSDGRYRSIYAPRAEGQELALRRAYEQAAFPIGSVGLIEAHGTGTAAGDQVEVAALRRLFGEGAPRVALGSVKSQIGHTKATAGAAGLIKAALAVHHKVLPPTINVTTPHPSIGHDESPLYLPTRARPWMRPPDGAPRRAGVSAFGFGGSNFHVALEEHEHEQQGAYRLQRVPNPVILWAETPGALRARLCEAARALDGAERARHFAALLTGSAGAIPPEMTRVGLLARTADEAREGMARAADLLERRADEEAWEHPGGISFRARGLDSAGGVVALFPGQGAQYLEMGREAAVNYPEVRAAFAAMDALFAGDPAGPLSAIVYPPPTFDPARRAAQEAALQQTVNAQPAIGALSMASYAILRQHGFRPDFAAGHSFGELTALWAAGVLDDAGFRRLARARGTAMAPPDRPGFDAGAMLAVRGDAGIAGACCAAVGEVRVANSNAPDQVVLAGPTPAIAAAERWLAERGIPATRLPVAAAFHTPLVAHAARPFAAVLDDVPFAAPRIPVYANATGRPYPGDPGAMRALLAEQLLHPVQFQRQIEAIYAAGGRVFVECGPRRILTTLVHRILADAPHLAVALNPAPERDSDRQFREALLHLRVAGLPLMGSDPYERRVETAGRRDPSPATVMLNGSNYVSARTREALERALSDGRGDGPSVIGTPAPVPSTTTTAPASDGAAPAATPEPTSGLTVNGHGTDPTIKPLGLAASERDESARRQGLHQDDRGVGAYFQRNGHGRAPEAADDSQAVSAPLAPARTQPAADTQGTLEGLAQVIAAFCQYQHDTLSAHQQFLLNQAGYTQGFYGLMQQQQALLCSLQQAPPAGVLELISGSMDLFHQQQMETARVHQQYLEYQAGHAGAMLAALRGQESELPRLAPALPPALPSAPLAREITPRMEQPAAVAPMIAGASVPRLEPAPLAVAPGAPAIHDAQAPAVPVSDAAPAPSGASHVAPPVAEALLAVVSEKTGYPVDTLELDMDLEADLGIDSIKRVEILGAMRDRYPDAPTLKPEQLAELRTLAAIVEFLAAHAPGREAGVLPVMAPPTSNGAAAPASGANGTAPSPDDLWYAPVRPRPLPPPDWQERTFVAGYSCLLVGDGGELTEAVAAALSALGWPVGVLTFPSDGMAGRRPLPDTLPRAELTDLEEASLRQARSDMADRAGPVAVCVFLQPSTDRAGQDGIFRAAEERMSRAALLIARELQPSIRAAARAGFGAFLAVTRLDGSLGTGQERAFGVVAGGLPGLVKTLRLEWEETFCRAVDLDPALDARTAAAHVVAELHDPDRGTAEVGYGSAGRITLVADPRPAVALGRGD